MIKRRKDNDNIGPSKGWAKFFHRLFLFITFPLRKPKLFALIILVLFLLYLSPMLTGIKFSNLNQWYLNQFRVSSNVVTQKAKEMTASLPSTEGIISSSADTKPKIVQIPAKTSGRRAFERAKSPPVVIAPAAVEVAPVSQNIAIEQADIQVVAVEPPSNRISGLKYLTSPQVISGRAEIVNANELKVGGIEMFLYGIYSTPQTTDGQAAKEYLIKSTKDRAVDCSIIAYTQQSIATAICKVGNVSLNHKLVELGFSKNVSLD